MPERPPLELRVSGPARRDTVAILKWSQKEFGEAAALRYAALMAQAFRDIADDPERPGSNERPEIMIKGARTYHLEFSRNNVIGPRVREPRHFLIYRRRGDAIEVARILHDSRDLARHVPARSSRYTEIGGKR